MALPMKTTTNVKEIYPNMVYTGFKAAPMALLRVSKSSENDCSEFGCIVGTLEGSIEWLPLVKGGMPVVIFQHPFESPVQAIIKSAIIDGKLQFAAQFRGEEVIIFEMDHSLTVVVPVLTVCRKLAMTHAGFCRFLVDVPKNSVILPSKPSETAEGITIHYENGGEKSVIFGQDFLFDSFQKQYPDTTFKKKKCFNGSLMHMELIDDGPVAGEKRLLAAFEDATFFVFDFLTKQVVALFKPPVKYCQLIGFASIREDDKLVIVVTVMSRVFELVYKNNAFEITKKIRTTGHVNVECSHLAFTPDGSYLICVFSSGKVEFYRRPDYELERVMYFHKAKIYAIEMDSKNDERGRLLVGDESGRLSEMSLEKLII